MSASGAARAFDNGGCETPFIVDGDLHRWNLFGCDMQIEMHAHALYRIAYDLLRQTAAQASGHGGLLLGEVERLDQETVDVKVVGVEPCESGSLPSVLTDCGSVLGFYRIVDQGELAFSDFDMNLALSRFPCSDKVFLLVKPSGSGTARACFFFWNDKELGSEHVEFPIVECQGGVTPFGWLENIPSLPPSSTK